MSTNQQNKKNDEEVDLGALFLIIGRGFSKFFNFIGGIFKSLFHVLIITLIFLKVNIVKIGIAGLIGLTIGVFLETKTSKKYGSELLLEPNFESTRQLYKNVNYYNDLVEQQKIEELQRVFNLDSVDATSLKKFKIEPVKIDNNIIEAYDELILNVDTLTIKSYKYQDFKASFTEYDYKIHKISVIAEKNDVFNKLDNAIISSVENNPYYNRFKNLVSAELDRKDSLYKQNLTQLDSLRRVYMRVMLEEAKNSKSITSTNIDLGGGAEKTTKDMEIFETSRKINYALNEVIEKKTENYEVINVISNFQPIGYEIKGVTKNYAFLLFLISSGLMIAFLLLIKLNKFLENYNR
jgi:hypothetical protein